MADKNISHKPSVTAPRGPGRAMGPGSGFITNEKPKNFKKTMKKLVMYCRPFFVAIGIAIIFSMVGTIFSIVGPNKLREITDLITAGIMTNIDVGRIFDIGLLLVILYGFSGLLSYVQGFIMATITQRVSKSLRTDISQKINKLPLRYFDNTSYGDVLSRVTNDVDAIGQTLNQSVGTLVGAVTMLIGSLVMMLLTNVVMTLAAIGATVIGFVLMIVIMSKSQKYFFSQQQELGLVNGHIEETYSGHTVVKVCNANPAAQAKFNGINDRLYESAWKSQFFSGIMMPLMSFIGNFGYVAVSVIGGIMAFNGTITFGVIVAFMIYIRLFTQPLSQMAQVATSLQSTAAASERVFEFLQEEEIEDETHKTKVLHQAKGDISFENVKFGYDASKPIIHGFSAHAKAGQKIAIVGPTGAGKTTLVNLLMRFYEVDAGVIKIDGIPIQDLTRENVHQLFCMVLQDTWLFEGTIKENIIYSKENVTEEEVISACKAVGIHYFIKTLSKGYNTLLDDKANLSAGQKQLITIARALVENAPLLILDEATSSVDTRTEVLIQQAMDTLMVGRTSFVIAHRLSTIKNADLILVMKDGDIIESGKHQALLDQNGFYAKLYNSQFEQAS